MMQFHYTDLETCHEATGVVIVIDVLRAFSTAAFAFSRGAREILPVSRVEEALELKAQLPNSTALGEVGGLAPEGFNFGNSPTQIREQDFTGLTLIQRTGAGTQGAVRCKKADILVAASFVVASSTIKYVSKLEPEDVTFVITGIYNNDEDLACAQYLEALMKGVQPDPNLLSNGYINSRDALQHLDPALPDFPLSDLDHCTQIDRFDFAMPITKMKNSSCAPSNPDTGASMYKLGVKRDFIARHFLIGGDWGAENLPNSHHYILELQLAGKELDQHGYLVDIVDVEKHLDEIVNYYKEQMLNDKPEFAGLNPSIEHFARILATSLSERIRAENITELKVVLWENESAWASFLVERQKSNV